MALNYSTEYAKADANNPSSGVVSTRIAFAREDRTQMVLNVFNALF